MSSSKRGRPAAPATPLAIIHIEHPVPCCEEFVQTQEDPLQRAGQERRRDVRPVRLGESGDRQETIAGAAASPRYVLKEMMGPERAKTD